MGRGREGSKEGGNRDMESGITFFALCVVICVYVALGICKDLRSKP